VGLLSDLKVRAEVEPVSEDMRTWRSRWRWRVYIEAPDGRILRHMATGTKRHRDQALEVGKDRAAEIENDMADRKRSAA